MEEKEKAKELYSNYYKILFHTNADPIHSKQCALIAVDELINNSHSDKRTDYWKQVKYEIEQL